MKEVIRITEESKDKNGKIDENKVILKLDVCKVVIV